MNLSAVFFPQVSLALSEAVIEYDPLQSCSVKLAEMIDDMGFPAAPKQVTYKDAVVFIQGMTCMNCVHNIESNLLMKDGVKFVRVSLDQSLGYVKFDPQLTAAETLRDVIRDMGFGATLQRPQDVGVRDIRTTTVLVDGMTCQSCVNSIEGNMSKKPGVLAVKVSLQQKEAVIKYDAAATNPETLCEQIDDMGFDARLATKAEAKAEGEQRTQTTRINIEGMTCNSCVKNIEGVVSEEPGVTHITVSLEKKLGTVQYDPKVTNPEKLRDRIDDMGFEASVAPDDQDEFEALAKREKRKSLIKIHVEGMTCNNCVRQIEGMMSGKPGVTDINVSLKGKEAVIEFDPLLTSPENLCHNIADLGFTSSLDKDFDDIAMRNAPQVSAQADRCVIAIEGMTCNSCVKTIESNMGDVDGIIEIKVSLQLKNAMVKFNPSKLSPEKIAEMIDDSGFEAMVAESGNGSSKCSKLVLKISGMHCNSCTRTIEGKLKETAGVHAASVSLLREDADITYDPGRISPQQLCKVVKEAGDFSAAIGGTCCKGFQLKSLMLSFRYSQLLHFCFVPTLPFSYLFRVFFFLFAGQILPPLHQMDLTSFLCQKSVW